MRVDDGTVAFGSQGDIRRYRPATRTDELLLRVGTGAFLRANVTGNKLVWGTFQSVPHTIFNSADLATSFQFELQADAFTSDRFGARRAWRTSGDEAVITDGQGVEIGRVSAYVKDMVLSDDGEKLVLGVSSPSYAYRAFDLTPLTSGGDAIVLGEVPTTSSVLLSSRSYLTPHQDEVVVCGLNRVAAVALP